MKYISFPNLLLNFTKNELQLKKTRNPVWRKHNEKIFKNFCIATVTSGLLFVCAVSQAGTKPESRVDGKYGAYVENDSKSDNTDLTLKNQTDARVRYYINDVDNSGSRCEDSPKYPSGTIKAGKNKTIDNSNDKFPYGSYWVFFCTACDNKFLAMHEIKAIENGGDNNTYRAKYLECDSSYSDSTADYPTGCNVYWEASDLGYENSDKEGLSFKTDEALTGDCPYGS